jgi:hypothetical protein
MSRRELGFAVAGAIGLLAGGALASPQAADASSDVSQGNFFADVSPAKLVLTVGGTSLFYKEPSAKVTSGDPRICSVEEVGGFFNLKMNGRGLCKIAVHDTATGVRGEFSVLGV